MNLLLIFYFSLKTHPDKTGTYIFLFINLNAVSSQFPRLSHSSLRKIRLVLSFLVNTAKFLASCKQF